MSVSLRELVQTQLDTTQKELDELRADERYQDEDFRSQLDWNDGWISAMFYIKQLIEKGVTL